MHFTRKIIEAPLIKGENTEASGHSVSIKAQPNATGDECKFMLDREVFPGLSWFFRNAHEAQKSPLAKAIFEVEDVETVLIHSSVITITRKDKTQRDWEPLAKQVGQSIRALIESGEPAVSDDLKSIIPSEDEIRMQLQQVIDEEINPGVAGHGGTISIVDIKGNAVTINMGGGCQGCSSAAITLKSGIETTFRERVPAVGAIYDATDHAAGTNPFYS